MVSLWCYSQVWPSCWLWGIPIMVGCVLSKLKPSELYILSCGVFHSQDCRASRDLSYTEECRTRFFLCMDLARMWNRKLYNNCCFNQSYRQRTRYLSCCTTEHHLIRLYIDSGTWVQVSQRTSLFSNYNRRAMLNCVNPIIGFSSKQNRTNRSFWVALTTTIVQWK